MPPPFGALRFRCKACRADFSITSGTLFAFHKMPLWTYLAATCIFINEVKGKSALALSRDLDCQYKTAFVLAHKLRESMASELKGMRIGGEGEMVEVDGGYFGGYIKPANHKENRRDRRLAKNQNGKRKVVVVARERGGRTLVSVFKFEVDSLGFIIQRVNPASKLVADEATSWNALHAGFDVARIDHSKLYSTGSGIDSNGADGHFLTHPPGRDRASSPHCRAILDPLRARVRVAGGSPPGFQRGAGSGRGDLGDGGPVSVDWCGYWQRAVKKAA